MSGNRLDRALGLHLTEVTLAAIYSISITTKTILVHTYIYRIEETEQL